MRTYLADIRLSAVLMGALMASLPCSIDGHLANEPILQLARAEDLQTAKVPPLSPAEIVPQVDDLKLRSPRNETRMDPRLKDLQPPDGWRLLKATLSTKQNGGADIRAGGNEIVTAASVKWIGVFIKERSNVPRDANADQFKLVDANSASGPVAWDSNRLALKYVPNGRGGILLSEFVHDAGLFPYIVACGGCSLTDFRDLRARLAEPHPADHQQTVDDPHRESATTVPRQPSTIQLKIIDDRGAPVQESRWSVQVSAGSCDQRRKGTDWQQIGSTGVKLPGVAQQYYCFAFRRSGSPEQHCLPLDGSLAFWTPYEKLISASECPKPTFACRSG